MSRPSVLVTGTFNLIHADHLKLLKYAASIGDVTVGLNDHAYLLKKYGYQTNTLWDRIQAVRATGYVSRVFIFHDEHPGDLIMRLSPEVVVKGPDYENQVLPEQYAIDAVKAVLLFRPGPEQIHTRDLLGIPEKTIVHT